MNVMTESSFSNTKKRARLIEDLDIDNLYKDELADDDLAFEALMRKANKPNPRDNQNLGKLESPFLQL